MSPSPNGRWPYCFDLDDIEMIGVMDGGTKWIETTANVPGIKLTHTPTGTIAIADALQDREGNLRVAMQRLDQRLRRAKRG